jgi:hypothetical protein
MTLQTVLKQYQDHYIKIGNKINPTYKQRIGMAYYLSAADAVQTLIDQPTVVVPDSGLKFHRL